MSKATGVTGEKQTARKRGRPTMGPEQHLFDDLLAAVESALCNTSHLDLTVREIASNADTQIAMIHYYFENKDGLVFAALDHLSKDIVDSLVELKTDLQRSLENATERIVAMWIGIHRRHHRIASITLIESFRPDSRIWNKYSERMKTHTLTFTRMQEIVRLLVERGYYRPDTDIRMAAFAIISLVHSTVILGGLMSRLGHEVESLTGEAWVRLAVRMLDREFRPPLEDDKESAASP